MNDDLREKAAEALHLILDECDRREHPRRNDITYPCQFIADAVLAVVYDGNTVVPTPLLNDVLFNELYRIESDENDVDFQVALAGLRRAASVHREEGQANE